MKAIKKTDEAKNPDLERKVHLMVCICDNFNVRENCLRVDQRRVNPIYHFEKLL